MQDALVAATDACLFFERRMDRILLNDAICVEEKCRLMDELVVDLEEILSVDMVVLCSRALDMFMEER